LAGLGAPVNGRIKSRIRLKPRFEKYFWFFYILGNNGKNGQRPTKK
jgi:hypothetical protein